MEESNETIEQSPIPTYGSLLDSMNRHEAIRTAFLRINGKMQMEYTKSNDTWSATLLVVHGRALEPMIVPWTVLMIYTIIYIVIQETFFPPEGRAIVEWEGLFSFVLTSTLSLLLVFRLNRATIRFWDARTYWGDIVVQSRNFVGGLVQIGSSTDHQRIERDNAIRWMIASTISTMELLRGETTVTCFLGILTKDEVTELNSKYHPPVYAIDRARYHLHKMFTVDNDMSPYVAYYITNQMKELENQLNILLGRCGGLERIRSTPLPIVYVSHLRTFIIGTLVLYPLVWGASWGYTTIPAVGISAFAWLGIECAALEVESPFRGDRVNALNMNGFILGIISIAKQQLECDKFTSSSTSPLTPSLGPSTMLAFIDMK